MLNNLKHQDPIVVDLTENVLVSTIIPYENHAALRSGFAGYPANPRWSMTKFRAWKTGRQWREALAQGAMIVRSTDSMLVCATETEDSDLEEPPSFNQIYPLVSRQAAFVTSRIA
jgi:hypothetical protein